MENGVKILTILEDVIDARIQRKIENDNDMIAVLDIHY